MLNGFSKRFSLSQLVNLSLAVFLLVGIAATTYSVNNLTSINASAAKGGNSGGSAGGKNKNNFTGSCNEQPNPATHGGQYIVFGSGFIPNEILNVEVSDSGGLTVLLTTTDSSGNFQVSSYASLTGSYTAFVYDNGTAKSGMTLITSCSFNVL